MSIISTVPIEYQNYTSERLPHIGIYYVFPRYVDRGLCKEFIIDLRDLVTSGEEVISLLYNYNFAAESELLKSADRNRFQAIRTSIVPGISFRTLANLVAKIHFTDFIKKHEWLKSN